MTARAEHTGARPVVPLGPVPHRGGWGTPATPHPMPASRAGGGMFAGRACVSPTARLVAPAPVSSAGAGAPFGPAGSTYNTSGRPGHHGGAA